MVGRSQAVEEKNAKKSEKFLSFLFCSCVHCAFYRSVFGVHFHEIGRRRPSSYWHQICAGPQFDVRFCVAHMYQRNCGVSSFLRVHPECLNRPYVICRCFHVHIICGLNESGFILWNFFSLRILQYMMWSVDDVRCAKCDVREQRLNANAV